VCATLSDDQVALVVLSAGSAPSVHNSQPWKFSVTEDHLLLCADPDRALWVSDPTARALYISCGAALFSARVALRALGYEPQVRQLPHPEYPFTVLAVIDAVSGRPPAPAERELYDALWRRQTNRRPFSDERVPLSALARLRQAADQERAGLRVLDGRGAARVLTLAGEAGRQLSADAAHQAELREWIGRGRHDGIPAGALPLRPDASPSPVRDADFLSAAPERRARAAYERSPQLAVLTTETDEPEDWLQAGQALQHVLLVATVFGLSASFFYHLVERDDMHEQESHHWPWPENRQMIMRLGYGSPPVPVPRRPLTEIMPAMRDLRTA
jgi:nitroreductase